MTQRGTHRWEACRALLIILYAIFYKNTISKIYKFNYNIFSKPNRSITECQRIICQNQKSTAIISDTSSTQSG